MTSCSLAGCRPRHGSACSPSPLSLYPHGRPFSTTLSRASEVPGPADVDASGTTFLTLNQGQEKACFDLSWAGIDRAVVAAHIRAVPNGVAVVIPLLRRALLGTDSVSGCVAG